MISTTVASKSKFRLECIISIDIHVWAYMGISVLYVWFWAPVTPPFWQNFVSGVKNFGFILECADMCVKLGKIQLPGHE